MILLWGLDQMKLEEILKTLTEEIASMISTKTVIGEPVNIEGKTLIPVTKVSFGFGGGVGEGRNKSGNEGSGSGGGGGCLVEPVAFLVVTKEDVQLYTVKGKGANSQMADVIPEIMEIYKSIREGKKEESPEKEKSED